MNDFLHGVVGVKSKRSDTFMQIRGFEVDDVLVGQSFDASLSRFRLLGKAVPGSAVCFTLSM